MSDAVSKSATPAMGQRSGWPVWAVVLLCLIPAGAYYTFLICANFGDLDSGLHPAAPGLYVPVHYGLTFNSMLLHLLHFRFDVDPQAIGVEGSVRDGLTYAYFGIVPALLRAPLMQARDFATTDYTRLACLVAISAMSACKVATVMTVWRAAGRSEQRPLLIILLAATLFGGPQIQFLMASLWQEVGLWSAALASLFVYLAVRGLYDTDGFSPRLLAGMAVVAGFCLLTRVSTALGLYLALGLSMLALMWRDVRGAERYRFRDALRRVLPAGAILGCFIVIAFAINFARWGSPLAFTGDIHSSLIAMQTDPLRVARDAQYGQFNLIRVGYALAYYFAPVWALQDSSGHFYLESFRQRAIDSVELPPSSFFISDPLSIGLMIVGLIALARSRLDSRRERSAPAWPILAGLAVPIALMLTYASMTFRYRLEFYPLFDFCAVVGFAALIARPRAVTIVPAALAGLLGMVASHGLLVLSALGLYGDTMPKLGGGSVMTFYASFFQ
ncbi:MAG: hypothetical protein JO001_14050 [Alphaproteobacteria bacterium]|nr:hypothetical protein [Alphaproteobacteria bacterium]